MEIKPNQETTAINERERVLERLNLEKVPLSGVEHRFMGSTPRHKDLYKPEGIDQLTNKQIEAINELRANGYFYIPFIGSVVGLDPRAKLAIGFGQIDKKSRRVTNKPRILGIIEGVDDKQAVNTTRGEELTQRLYEYYKQNTKDLFDQLIKI